MFKKYYYLYSASGVISLCAFCMAQLPLAPNSNTLSHRHVQAALVCHIAQPVISHRVNCVATAVPAVPAGPQVKVSTKRSGSYKVVF